MRSFNLYWRQNGSVGPDAWSLGYESNGGCGFGHAVPHPGCGNLCNDTPIGNRPGAAAVVLFLAVTVGVPTIGIVVVLTAVSVVVPTGVLAVTTAGILSILVPTAKIHDSDYICNYGRAHRQAGPSFNSNHHSYPKPKLKPELPY